MKEFFTKLYIKYCVWKARLTVNLRHCFHKLTAEEKAIYKKCFLTYFVAFGLFLLVGSVSPAFLATYEIDTSGALSSYADAFNQIYTAVLPFATALSVMLVAYNLIVLMTSKNQKKCDTALTWIKAVIISWLCLALVFFVIIIAKNFYTRGKNSAGNVLFDY